MEPAEPPYAAPPPLGPWFQFGLGTLLLVFVVLGTSLALFGSSGVLVSLLIAVLAIYIRELGSLSSFIYFVLGLLGLGCLGALLVPSIDGEPGPSFKAACMDNVHQIANAIQAYHEAHGRYPPAYIADKAGTPLLSWRVMILPYLDQDALYKSFDLTQPWDGPTNRKLLARPPQIYACPAELEANPANITQTSYLAVMGKNAAWPGGKPAKLDDFSSEAENVITVVEVTNSGINWAEPRDLSLDNQSPASGKPLGPVFASYHRPRVEFFFTYEESTCVSAAFADCHVAGLHLGGLSPDELRKALAIGGFREGGPYGKLDGPVRYPNWRNIAALAVWLFAVGLLFARAALSRTARNRVMTDLETGERAR